MSRLIARLLFFVVSLTVIGDARAACTSLPYTFSNSTIADADQVNANFAALLACTQGLENANLLINPAISVDQINSGASVSGNGYVADQWTQQSFGGITISGQVVSDAPPGFLSSYKLTTVTGAALGAADFLSVEQPIESAQVANVGFGTSNAKQLCESFWAKSSIAPYVFNLTLRNQSNGIGGAVTRSYTVNHTVATAATWQFFSQCFTADTGGSWNIGVGTLGEALNFAFFAAAGPTYQGAANVWQTGNLPGTSSNTNSLYTTNGATFQFTGVKLEISPIVTPFVARDAGVELALNQRYVEKSYDATVAVGAVSAVGQSQIIAQAGGTTGGRSQDFKVSKRCDPTMTVYSPGTGTAAKVRDNINGVDVTAAVAGASHTNFAWSASPSVGVNINLSLQWVAKCQM